ncbi:FecR family protein [Sinomicrobium oceani]|uniref:FecR family protein n=1 Tax=Sinomicrobium oceani TaxID=1150368 RepID=A0A1K1QT92_9FLAO|nr:FecR family protein [Sinomicrobium oceani]SFW62981.1 FecR family protein [Sinomicrobium oceani]
MHTDIEKIYLKVIQNHPLTFEERRLLVKKLRDDPGLKPFLLHLKDIHHEATALKTSDLDEKKALLALKQRMKPEPKKALRIRPWMRYAAILTGILITGYSWYLFHHTTESNTPKITLQLEDGSVRELDESTVNIITGNNGRAIVSQKKNTLHYDHVSQPGETSVLHNVLNVPKAKTFQLILSDGTRILLNSGSRIRYPEAFHPGEKRIVQLLDGEAYFTVRHDSLSPFIVRTGKIDVKVLGTEFNISAYTEDSLLHTVLVSGGVKVRSEGGTVRELVPNQIATYNRASEQLSVQQVTVTDHIAWVDGKMRFVDKPFGDILKTIERSYDVKIINRNKKLQHARFYGDFDIHKESVNDVLKVFATGRPFSYERNGNVITILPDADKKEHETLLPMP